MLCPGRFPSRLWAGTLTSSRPCWGLLMLSNQPWLWGTLCLEPNLPANRSDNCEHCFSMNYKMFSDLCWIGLARPRDLLPSPCSPCHGALSCYQWSVDLFLVIDRILESISNLQAMPSGDPQRSSLRWGDLERFSSISQLSHTWWWSQVVTLEQ